MSFFFPDILDLPSPSTEGTLTPPRSWSPSSSDLSSSPSTPEPFDVTRVSSSSPSPTRSEPAKRRGKPSDHIPRPPNAFVLFRASLAKKLNTRPIERDQRHVSQITSAAWKELDEETKAFWYTRAAEEKKLHAKKYPNYRFSPVARVDKPRKRNVKRNGPKDKERCKKLGKLISMGTSLHELESEAKRFDAVMKSTTETAATEETCGTFPLFDNCTTTVFDSKSWDASPFSPSPGSETSAVDMSPFRSPLLPPFEIGSMAKEEYHSPFLLPDARFPTDVECSLSAFDCVDAPASGLLQPYTPFDPTPPSPLSLADNSGKPVFQDPTLSPEEFHMLLSSIGMFTSGSIPDNVMPSLDSQLYHETGVTHLTDRHDHASLDFPTTPIAAQSFQFLSDYEISEPITWSQHDTDTSTGNPYKSDLCMLGDEHNDFDLSTSALGLSDAVKCIQVPWNSEL